MIEDITKKLRKIEGFKNMNQGGNKKNPQNNNAKKSQPLNKIYEQIDKVQITPVINPIVYNELPKDNEIQSYFNQKYLKINLDVRNIISLLSKNGNIKKLIDEAIFEISAAISQYFCDGNFDNFKNKKYKLIDENTIEVYDNYDSIIFLIKILKSQITSITMFDDEYQYDIQFKTLNLIDKIIGKTSVLKSYTKKDLSGNVIEKVLFNKNSIPEKYIKYQENIEYIELLFDTDTIEKGFLDKDKLIPKKYNLYDILTENKKLTLNYIYSKPDTYIEYNSRTQLPIKILKLQGLKNLVYKYSFFNSVNGQLITSGSL